MYVRVCTGLPAISDLKRGQAIYLILQTRTHNHRGGCEATNTSIRAIFFIEMHLPIGVRSKCCGHILNFK